MLHANSEFRANRINLSDLNVLEQPNILTYARANIGNPKRNSVKTFSRRCDWVHSMILGFRREVGETELLWVITQRVVVIP
jgi:hypothetical protein